MLGGGNATRITPAGSGGWFLNFNAPQPQQAGPRHLVFHTSRTMFMCCPME